jgi:hypothetical protein
MSASPLTRRAAVAALGAFDFPSAIAVRGALAQPSVRFRDVLVDVSRLRAALAGPTAAWVEQELPGALAQALTGYMAPDDRDGAILVARIDNIYLGPNSGGTAPGAPRRTLSMAFFWCGARMGASPSIPPVRAITSYHPMAVDQPLRVESNHWRVVALAQAFAGWVPRALGL